MNKNIYKNSTRKPKNLVLKKMMNNQSMITLKQKTFDFSEER
jgi:hypothetical protein